MKSSFSSKSQSTFYIDNLITATPMSSSPECSLTRSASLRIDKSAAQANDGTIARCLTLPKDLERLKEWSSECRSVCEEYSACCSADGTVTIDDVDALFGSFSRYTSFLQTISGPVSCPSSPVSDTPQTTEESVVTAKWFFDIVRQQHVSELEKKPLGAQSRASFVTFSGPMLAITHRSLLMDVKPRTAILSKRVFYLFKEANNNPKCKEKIAMSNVISLETSRPSGIKVHKDLFGIALKVGVEKNKKGDTILDRKSTGKAKSTRQSYIYAVHSEVEQVLWMQKLLESITRRFPAEEVTNCLYASQCYARYTLNSVWKRGWVVLTHQRRVVHCFDGGTSTVYDLRKMQLIQLTKEEAIKRSSILVECQPLKLHVIMDSEADTHKWYELIKSFELNLRNLTLEEQQMTNENVPVIVEKCLRFIFSYGSMSEDIYAVPGNTHKVKRLLEGFRDDAFGVQLAHTYYNEHDVASALQKFLRDLPKTVVGDLSASFMCVSDISLVDEKRTAYKELLFRLTSVEYQTLRSIIGHLYALHSLKHYNKMNARKLAVIWGKNLLTDLTNESQELFQKEINVVYDLIVDYKAIFVNEGEETIQEVAEPETSVADSRKVWIKVLPNESSVDAKLQMIPILVTPTKTVSDVCYELIFEMRLPPESMTMSEVILRGELQRPMHPNEIVLDTIQRWDEGWADARDSCLVVVPSKFFNHIEVLSNMKTDYVVRYKGGDQPVRRVLVELMDDRVLLVDDERKESLGIGAMHAYLNKNKSELTLIEDQGKRCHGFTVADHQDQVLLYVSIAKRYHQIHCHYETSEF